MLAPRLVLLTLLLTVAALAASACAALARSNDDVVSRPELRPPQVTIRRSDAGQAPGLIFVTPKKVYGAPPVPGAQGGREIVDAQGRVRYFRPNENGKVANDFKVQIYQGQPVLTYWYGRQILGSGEGHGIIEDQHYHRIARIYAGNGLKADFHELALTPEGTALITVYREVVVDGAKVVEGVIQEIDIATGQVVTEWDSLHDIPLSDSYEPRATRSGAAFDYLHLNAATLDTDGNILVSARHTWAIYKIERHTGRLLWTLGGKRSDFTMGTGAQTAWQHDIRAVGPNRITVFDNGAGDTGAPVLRHHSRVAEIQLDPDARTATLVRSDSHPGGLSAGTQGNAEALSTGGFFVGWGSQGVFSEFDADGNLIFDGRVPSGDDTYRAFKSPWVGRPTTRPSLAAVVRGSRIVVAASWNGSTEVRAWRVLTGRSPDHLAPADRRTWIGLETRLSLRDRGARYAAVQALGRDGQVLATSRAATIRR